MGLAIVAVTLLVVSFLFTTLAIHFLGAEDVGVGAEPLVRTRTRAARKRAKLVGRRRKAA